MANSTASVLHPSTENGNEAPNHLIIWLDKFIGKFNEYLLLKRSFFMTIDPTTGCAVSLTEKDINHSIQANQPIIVLLNGVQFMLRAFTHVDDCFEAIENNIDKRLFIITSGTKGRILVPALKTYLHEELKRNYPMYIFCGNMNMVAQHDVPATHAWALDFEDDLIMFVHEQDLQLRIVLDAAGYFYGEGDRLYKDNQLENARKRCEWVDTLLKRYEEMKPKTMITANQRTTLRELFDTIDDAIAQQNNDNDKCSYEAR